MLTFFTYCNLFSLGLAVFMLVVGFIYRRKLLIQINQLGPEGVPIAEMLKQYYLHRSRLLFIKFTANIIIFGVQKREDFGLRKGKILGSDLVFKKGKIWGSDLGLRKGKIWGSAKEDLDNR